MRAFGVLSLLLVLTGCGSVSDRADSAIDRVQNVHDAQLAYGIIATCGAPLRAVMAQYGRDPNALMAIFVLCGYDDEILAVPSNFGGR